MIDHNREQLVTLRETVKIPALCKNGRRPSTASVFRWAAKGIRGIRLETTRIGGSRRTSAEAVDRWIDQLNATDAKPAADTPTHRQRENSLDRACAELSAVGVS